MASPSPEYAAARARLALPEPPPADGDFVFKRREFIVPVFNRGAKLTFVFLVHSLANVLPVLSVGCEHLGARLVHRPQRQMFLGVVQTHAAGAGLAVGILCAVGVGRFVNSDGVAIALAFALGAAGTLLGAAVIHVKRWVVRTVG